MVVKVITISGAVKKIMGSLKAESAPPTPALGFEDFFGGLTRSLSLM